MRGAFYVLLPWPLFKRWSCNRAGVTGRTVFLTLTRNSSICSNSVSLAWTRSHTSIWTTVGRCEGMLSRLPAAGRQCCFAAWSERLGYESCRGLPVSRLHENTGSL